MKKVLIILLIIIILAGVGVGGYFVIQTKFLNRDEDEILSELNANANVTSVFEFKAPKVKKKTEIIKADVNGKSVPLYLGDGYYYLVIVPADVGIVTDYATYVYGTNMSYKINIVKNVDASDIGKSMAMSNYIEYTQSIDITKSGIKKPQEAATVLIDDVGILATCYDSPIAFATILNGFETEHVRQYKVSEIKGDNKTVYCGSVSDIPVDANSGTNSLLSSYKDAGAYMYRYEDGWLTEFNATRGHEDVKHDMLTRVMLADANAVHLDRVFESDLNGVKFYYAEVGSHTILCISDTINHTYACLGNGNTARQDIITYLRNVYIR